MTDLFVDYPYLDTFGALSLLLLLAFGVGFVVKKIILRGVLKLLRGINWWNIPQFKDEKIINYLVRIVPAVIIIIGIDLVPNIPSDLRIIIYNVCSAFIILTLVLAVDSFLSLINLLYEKRTNTSLRSIKSYIQLGKILIYAVGSILIIATLIDRSPLILLSGLGAMAAVLMLIFQDTLLSMVASVQIHSNDIIRVGDWVEMPALNADGDVIDIALHTVKVQNWDKTITTIPTKKFISDSFKNWRGMQESGGRRIKRSIFIDQTSVHFLTEEEINKLHKLRLLDEYLSHKESEINSWNNQLGEYIEIPANQRRLTNLGTFRAYIERYLRSSPYIAQNMTLLVRQLSPTADGLPLELYCFTNTTAWAQYEAIQSDIFDHMLAIMPEFNLHVFQHPSGDDLQKITQLSFAKNV